MRQSFFLLTILTLPLSAQSFFSQTSAAKKKYLDVQSQLRDIAGTHSKTTTLVKITDSDSGRIVEGLKIGNGKTPQLIVATHHGNEYSSTEVALAAAKDFAEHPVAGKSIYVVPVINISGYDRKNRYERIGSRSFDPNRDYEGPCGTEGPFKLKSTRGLAKFIADKKIVAAATIHSYWPAVLYPWGASATNFSTAYNKIFRDLARVATSLSNYETGFSGEVIYPADGTFEDYAFWRHGVWSLLFEIGGSHHPSQKDIDDLIRVNVPGLRRMMEDAPLTVAAKHGFTAECSMKKGVDPRLE